MKTKNQFLLVIVLSRIEYMRNLAKIKLLEFPPVGIVVNLKIGKHAPSGCLPVRRIGWVSEGSYFH